MQQQRYCTVWPIKKNDTVTNLYMVSALCVYLGTFTSTVFLKVLSVRDEERIPLEKYFPYKCYKPKGFDL